MLCQILPFLCLSAGFSTNSGEMTLSPNHTFEMNIASLLPNFLATHHSVFYYLVGNTTFDISFLPFESYLNFTKGENFTTPYPCHSGIMNTTGQLESTGNFFVVVSSNEFVNVWYGFESSSYISYLSYWIMGIFFLLIMGNLGWNSFSTSPKKSPKKVDLTIRIPREALQQAFEDDVEVIDEDSDSDTDSIPDIEDYDDDLEEDMI
jgi:hypothetical protein